MTNQPTTPREIDTKLAELYERVYRAEDRLATVVADMKRAAGATFYYRGRQRVTDMTTAEAIEKLTARAAYVAEYKAANAYVDGDYHGTNWDTFEGAAHEADRPAESLARYAEFAALISELHAEIEALGDRYTGWSRFFLVTSSAGHVHSSMSCSTCRPTTRYGWLPALSGKSEAEAVEDLGPTLCSVCFPSAPVEWTTGKKLTAAQAARRAA